MLHFESARHSSFNHLVASGLEVSQEEIYFPTLRQNRTCSQTCTLQSNRLQRTRAIRVQAVYNRPVQAKSRFGRIVATREIWWMSTPRGCQSLAGAVYSLVS